MNIHIHASIRVNANKIHNPYVDMSTNTHASIKTNIDIVTHVYQYEKHEYRFHIVRTCLLIVDIEINMSLRHVSFPTCRIQEDRAVRGRDGGAGRRLRPPQGQPHAVPASRAVALGLRAKSRIHGPMRRQNIPASACLCLGPGLYGVTYANSQHVASKAVDVGMRARIHSPKRRQNIPASACLCLGPGLYGATYANSQHVASKAVDVGMRANIHSPKRRENIPAAACLCPELTRVSV